MSCCFDLEAPAVFDDDRVYRYTLLRRWGPGPAALFVMLNPSTADEAANDPTVRRCIAFARAWGFSTLRVGNLFALRATDPRALNDVLDPVGPKNNAALLALAGASDLIVCAWGARGSYMERDIEVLDLLAGAGHELTCLARTAGGEPKHPLYLRRDVTPTTLRGRGVTSPWALSSMAHAALRGIGDGASAHDRRAIVELRRLGLIQARSISSGGWGFELTEAGRASLAIERVQSLSAYMREGST